MPTVAEQLFELMPGLERAHGTFVPEGIDRRGKLTGKPGFVHEPITVEDWDNHLEGKVGLGVCPIREDATAAWAAIDIDDHQIDLAGLENRVKHYSLPLVVARSKSGGAHVFVFAKDYFEGETVRQKLADWAVLLGHPHVEIYPKQSELPSENEFGSWLNMPYFNGMTGGRYGIENGKAVEVERFIEMARSVAITNAELEAIDIQDSDEFLDGMPPCIQHICKEGAHEGNRNNFFFHAIVAIKKKWPDDWETKANEFNLKYIVPPLDNHEAQDTIKSHRKKDYGFKCEEPLMKRWCSKAVCRTRDFGIAGEQDLGATVENVVKLTTEPPMWQVSVDGKPVTFSAINDFWLYPRFRSMVGAYLNRRLNPMSQKAWDKIVTPLWNNMEVRPEPPDATESEELWGYIAAFVTSRSTAHSRDDLLSGLPWIDEDMVWFRIGDVQRYLKREGVKPLRTHLWILLSKRGAKSKQISVKGRSTRVWGVKKDDLLGEEIPEE